MARGYLIYGSEYLCKFSSSFGFMFLPLKVNMGQFTARLQPIPGIKKHLRFTCLAATASLNAVANAFAQNFGNSSIHYRNCPATDRNHSQHPTGQLEPHKENCKLGNC